MTHNIRKATIKDIPDITDIYNYYVKTSVVCLDKEAVTEDYFEQFLESSAF